MKPLKRHVWEKIQVRTPSGKTRTIDRCEDCGLLTYSAGRLTRWVYCDGRSATTQTSEAPTCHGKA